MEITIQDLIEAVRQANNTVQEKPAGWFTSAEYAKETGLSVGRARVNLKKATQSGALECKTMPVSISGGTYKIYRVKRA